MPQKKPTKKLRNKKDDVKYITFQRESDLPPAAISLASTMYNKTGKWRSIRPVIDYQKCISCMICWKFCPDAAIRIVSEKPQIALDYCKGCAICAEECPVKAIELQEEKK
ncbi:MAG: 4Fe-4S binding protein [Candidatus Omnitrophica bacterium]|nr:4Fe-4S binding protein [Candidatus Omnitrophota bacterium]MBU4488859.1 4Fe-4S binding protein [Candidatus Omnitrophota bacterium]MCG2705657.1 4Fe-4S binding protein [Candidatus Omnitrophota bacterium]